MINIDKVRKWTVRFSPLEEFSTLPKPEMIVEEVEGASYFMPQYSVESLPPDLGGQLTLTLEGEGRLKVGKKEYICSRNTAFLYRECDKEVSYFHPGNKYPPWRFIWINFTGRTSELLIKEINEKYGYFFSGTDELKMRLKEFEIYSGATLFQSPLERAHLIFELLDLLCRSSRERQTSDPGKRIVQEVRNELNKSVREHLNITILAKKLAISREHLSKTFHQTTGQTLMDYCRQQKLKDALNLLLKSSLSCKEIALLCHFNSYSSFYRSFLREYKASPEDFRKNRR